MTTLRIDSRRYEDSDDCLAACAADVATDLGLEGWSLSPRWEDDERDAILVDIPAHAAEAATEAGYEAEWCALCPDGHHGEGYSCHDRA
jgi:hypothetical protein